MKSREFANDRIPLYYQLMTLLRDRIRLGECPPGSRIPSELELSRTYGVSRVTVRQAIGELVREGLLLRRPGVGTFVAPNPRSIHTSVLTGPLLGLRTFTEETEVRPIGVELCKPDPEVAEALHLEPGTRCVRVERVRVTPAGPVALVVNYLPETMVAGVPRDQLAVQSMLAFAEKQLGVRVHYADQTVSAVLADVREATLLDVRVGDPLLHTQRVYHLANGTPVWYTRTWYRVDRFRFRIRLYRSEPGLSDDHGGSLG